MVRYVTCFGVLNEQIVLKMYHVCFMSMLSIGILNIAEWMALGVHALKLGK